MLTGDEWGRSRRNQVQRDEVGKKDGGRESRERQL